MTGAERAALAGALASRRPGIHRAPQPVDPAALADAEAVLAALAADGWQLTETTPAPQTSQPPL
ncbi:hypothetical protein HUT18_18420 [Streptomyces sp. NA04227]|uniref:hypothetical protein n=1 Tax=Streptomyces sp. NA04227 TaxID=2742136 RepID=UPI001590408E|nr:hypothetical protein [Streptomyces sp. NA04227]QKW08062.1 hypothetical protein HUT18_18420 [Streptomyces sp. NA04227]